MTSTASSSRAAIDLLLDGLIDYAGLFPPAALDMQAAVTEYAWAAASPDRAALARFVVPAARLDEFTRAVALHPDARGWRLSALLGEDLAGDLLHISAANAFFGGAGAQHQVDCVELRAASPVQAAERLAVVPAWLARFVEFPVSAEPEPFLDAIAAAGASAKVRMGGITADAFPATAHVARFLRACLTREIAFKATAGLHHPLRGAYRLTYEPGADLAGMYGYLNLFLAAALVQAGGSDDEIHALLLEHEAASFTITPDTITWRTHRFTRAALAELRAHSALAIGSCSFREPLDDLRALGFR